MTGHAWGSQRALPVLKAKHARYCSEQHLGSKCHCWPRCTALALPPPPSSLTHLQRSAPEQMVAGGAGGRQLQRRRRRRLGLCRLCRQAPWRIDLVLDRCSGPAWEAAEQQVGGTWLPQGSELAGALQCRGCTSDVRSGGRRTWLQVNARCPCSAASTSWVGPSSRPPCPCAPFQPLPCSSTMR